MKSHLHRLARGWLRATPIFGTILLELLAPFRAQLLHAAGESSPASSPIQAAYVWEFEPRPGEQRFNRAIYKASHNSFARRETLNEQIDTWNAWSLELDLWSFGEQILVAHEDPCGISCCPCDVPSFQAKLDEITAASTLHDRVTVLDLQLHVGSRDTAAFGERIEAALRAKFGAEHIYRAAEFASSPPHGDGLRWPSYQELVRRGKNFIVVAHPCPDDPFFFRTTSTFPPSQDETPNAVLAVIENAASPAGELGDRYLTRTWHGSCLGFPDVRQHCNCEIEDGFWDRAVHLRFNFIATYCIDRSWTMALPTHSPVPLFVTMSGDSSAPKYGTHTHPFWGRAALLEAAKRTSPMVDIHVAPGTYDFGAEGQRTFATAAIVWKNAANILTGP